MKRIVVAGGSGFIGAAIVGQLKKEGYESVVLSRGSHSVAGADRTAAWNGKDQGDWVKELEGAHAVINLSGESIMTLFTPEAKKRLRDSRLQTTEAIGKAIASLSRPPRAWVNASAMGYYGDAGDRVLGESAPRGSGFLAELCEEWEDAVHLHATPATRKAQVRVAMVMGRGGGAFQQLSMVTKAFAGSALGSGRQWVSWIHLEDMARLFVWAATEPTACGPINGGSPHPVTNGELMAAFREVYGRPPLPNAPEFMIRLVSPLMKVEPDLLLISQRMKPVMALAKGFEFKHPDLRPALDTLVEAEGAKA